LDAVDRSTFQRLSSAGPSGPAHFRERICPRRGLFVLQEPARPLAMYFHRLSITTVQTGNSLSPCIRTTLKEVK
jgi:hypothetical protein